MERVFLSLGSNLGDRAFCLKQALERLEALQSTTLSRVSSVYETEPWGETEGEEPFLNLVAEIETTIEPQRLLALLQKIEGELGRRPARGDRARYEPRTIDIDILLYGDRIMSDSDWLQIPHLHMHERRFVLLPLAEIAPEVVHPTLYRSIRELLDELEDAREVTPFDTPQGWFAKG